MKQKVVVQDFTVEVVDSQFDYPKIYLNFKAACPNTKQIANINTSKLRSLVQVALELSIDLEG